MADPVTTTAAVQAAVDLAPLGKGLAFGIAAGGAGIGIGLVFASAIQGIARQPEQAGVLRGLTFLGFAFIEALALIGFVMNWLIK
ncbi:MAG: ATP synthase F0 subunit C [Planctomycetes bacterium]|jgi:F-type H+-transporting ATPase subunit c|nr:ATP synthase F0 subunit C [Planctomycetota bacterium]